jgi:hypothetical protein
MQDVQTDMTFCSAKGAVIMLCEKFKAMIHGDKFIAIDLLQAEQAMETVLALYSNE